MKNQSIFTLIFIGIAQILCAQNFKSFTTADGLPSNNVQCVAVDQDDIIWFGTQEGLVSYDRRSWITYDQDSYSELASDNITAVAVASNGNIWVGTDGGVSVFDGTQFTTYKTSDGLGSNRINYITPMSNGDIWLSDFNGATKYDGTSFKAYKTADGLPFGGVECIAEDINGDVIMATGLGGMIVFDGTSFTEITKESTSLLSNNMTALAIDATGKKWTGTSDGISVFGTDNSWIENHSRIFIMPPPDTLNPIEDIQIDSKGNVWAGVYVDYLVTVGGISKFDGSSWTDYDVSDGLAGPTVRKLAIDSKDDVWVATSAGVTLISDGSVGIPDVVLEKDNMWPNPAISYLNVELYTSGVTTIEIFNAFGQKVLSSELGAEKSLHRIDIKELSSGTYFVKLGENHQKLIVR
ncbi:MAG: two-component regulator propeller domain-containing protein [Bacteroidia bacterium]